MSGKWFKIGKCVIFPKTPNFGPPVGYEDSDPQTKYFTPHIAITSSCSPPKIGIIRVVLDYEDFWDFRTFEPCLKKSQKSYVGVRESRRECARWMRY